MLHAVHFPTMHLLMHLSPLEKFMQISTMTKVPSSIQVSIKKFHMSLSEKTSSSRSSSNSGSSGGGGGGGSHSSSSSSSSSSSGSNNCSLFSEGLQG